MTLNKFIPVSPDLNIQSDADMTVAKFGHINSLVDQVNTNLINSFTFPTYTTAERNALTPVEGQAAYDTTTHKLYVYDGSIWQAAW